MKQIWNAIQMTFTAIGGGIGWFLGGMDGMMIALITFAVIDYITGVMRAVIDRKLSSAVGFRGIFKKILIFCFVGVGHVIDTVVIRSGSVLRTAIIIFYLSNEGISLLDNAGHLGLPIPDKLRSVLEQLHHKSNQTEK